MANSTEQPLRTSLDEFRAVLLDYKSISSWAMGGSVAVPLVDYVVHLGPPWPSASGVPIITSVVELLTLICVFHFWSRSNRKAVGRRMVGLIVLLCVFFAGYLYLNSSFTFSSPVNGEKYVKGCELRPDVAPIITPDYSSNDALRDAEYKPEEVWTSSSITTMRLSVLCLWLCSFVSLSAAISSFVLYHRGRPARRQPSAQETPNSSP